MLKYLIKKGYVNIHKLLLDNYLQLGLKENELIIIYQLFELLNNNQATISIMALAKKTSLCQDETANILNGLFNRGLVTIDIEYTKTGKAKETFSLDDLIMQIEKICVENNKLIVAAENETVIKQIVTLCEHSLQKSLSQTDLEIILTWVNSGVTINAIKQALYKANQARRKSLQYVDTCLLQAEELSGSDIALDDKKIKIVTDVYRNIK